MLVWRAETTTVVRGDAGLPAFLGMWVLSRAADGFPDLHADDLHAAHAGGSIFVFGFRSERDLSQLASLVTVLVGRSITADALLDPITWTRTVLCAKSAHPVLSDQSNNRVPSL